MKKYFPLLLIVPLFFSSCKKEEISLLVQEVNSHTAHHLRDVFFVNDSIGYICGGDKYGIGIFLRTTDDGKTWSEPDSIFNACAYSLQFFSASQGIVAGNSSNWATSSDSGKTFSVSQSDYLTINKISFFNQQRGVKVGGDGYANGYISTTGNGGASWSKAEIPNNMMAVQFTDSNTVFSSGYGVIYKSTDGGHFFNPLDVRGDFFVAMDFPSAQVGYFAGYEGMILKTSNAGNSFQKIRNGNAPLSERVHFECIKFWDEATGYAAGDNGVMYKTDNGGDSWEKIKSFTDVNLRAIHLFSATLGIVVGDNGKIFLFKNF